MTLARADLALRMRNQLALELLDRSDEHVIDDEPVLISTGADLRKKGRGQGLPKPGWVIVTNVRMLLATVTEPDWRELSFAEPRVTHIEDGWVTLAWHDRGRRPTSVTVGFGPRTKLLREIVLRIPGDRVMIDIGDATPHAETRRDRFEATMRRAVRRSDSPDGPAAG